MKRHLFLLAAAFALLTSAVAAAPKPAGSVRFLCVSELPPKYRLAPNGAYVAVPYAFGEAPPASLFTRKGDRYERVPFDENGLSASYAPGETGASPDADRLFVRATGDAATPGAAAVSWVPYIAAPKADGRDRLVCLFQPDHRAKWLSPRRLDVDISRDVLAPGSCLVVNLTDAPVYAQLGAGTEPIALKPGESRIAAPGGDESGFVLKAAAGPAGDKLRAIGHRRVNFARPERAVIAIHTSAGARSGVRLRVFPLIETDKPDRS